MPGPAEMLRRMADRIDRNDPDEFAGCLVIIPPEGGDGVEGGDPVEILFINPVQDLALFWSTVKNRSAIAADEWVSAQQNQMGGYR